MKIIRNNENYYCSCSKHIIQIVRTVEFLHFHSMLFILKQGQYFFESHLLFKRCVITVADAVIVVVVVVIIDIIIIIVTIRRKKNQ